MRITKKLKDKGQTTIIINPKYNYMCGVDPICKFLNYQLYEDNTCTLYGCKLDGVYRCSKCLEDFGNPTTDIDNRLKVLENKAAEQEDRIKAIMETLYGKEE